MKYNFHTNSFSAQLTREEIYTEEENKYTIIGGNRESIEIAELPNGDIKYIKVREL